MIDDKLKQIKVKCYDGGLYLNDSSLSDKNIAQIKQAFADEGYVKVAKDNQDKIKSAQIYSIEHGSYELMTGQEWYDRFVKECLALPKDHNYTDMLEAAKKASSPKGTSGL